MSNRLSTEQQALFMPMHLDALVVPGQHMEGLAWKNVAHDLQELVELETQGIGRLAEADIDQGAGDCFHAKGIHLHWTLPDLFRTGKYNEDANELQFPRIPNRWLIVRTDSTQQRASWIVESDRIVTPQDKNRKYNWLEKEAGSGISQITVKCVGAVYPDARKWGEQTGDRVVLSAVSAAAPAFAAAYVHSKDVLGFYDAMHNVGINDTLNYRVYGWFSDRAHDPLFGVSSSEQFMQKLTDLAIIVSDAGKITDVPGKMICHAMIQEVRWNEQHTHSVPSLAGVKAGIGNSTAEAFSGLMADKVAAAHLATPEKLLAAYQYKFIRDNGLQDNAMKMLCRQTHAQGFIPTPGGSQWAIEPAESDAEENKGVAFDAPFNAQISIALHALNSEQERMDRAVWQLRSWQALLNAAIQNRKYIRRMDAKVLPDADQNIVKKKLEEEASALIKKIKQLRVEIGALKSIREKRTPQNEKKPFYELFDGTIADRYKALETELNAAFAKKELKRAAVIVEVPQPKFYEPSDPVLVIDGINPAERYAGRQPITARVSSQFVTAIELTVPGTTTTFMFQLEDLGAMSYPGSDNPQIPTAIMQLVNESMLFDLSLIPRITDWVLSRDRAMFTDALKASLIAILRRLFIDLEVKDNEQRFLRADKAQYSFPPKYAMLPWTQPWVPLYMEWSIDWCSTDVSEAWQLKSEQTFYDMGMVANSNTHRSKTAIKGRTLLSSDLVNKTEELNKKLKSLDDRHFMRSFIDDLLKIFSNDEINTNEYTDKQLVGLAVGILTEEAKIADDLLKQELKAYAKSDCVHFVAFLVQQIGKLNAATGGKLAGWEEKLKTHGAHIFFENIRPVAQALSGFNIQLLSRSNSLQLPVTKPGKQNVIDNELDNAIDDGYTWGAVAEDGIFQPLRGGALRFTYLRIVDSFGQVLNIIKDGNWCADGVEGNNLKSTLSTAAIDSKQFFVLPPRVIQPARLSFDWVSNSHSSSGRITDSDPGTTPVCGWLVHNPLSKNIAMYDADGADLGFFSRQNGVGVTFTASNTAAVTGEVTGQIKDIFLKGIAFEDMLDRLVKMTEKLEPGSTGRNLFMSMPLGSAIAIVRARCRVELKESAAMPQGITYLLHQREEADYFSTATFGVNIGDAASRKDGVVALYNAENAGDVALLRPFSFTEANTQLQVTPGKDVPLIILMDPRGAVNVSCSYFPSVTYQLPQRFIQQPLQNLSVSFLVAPLLTPATGIKMPLMDIPDMKWQWLQKDKAGGADKVTEPEPVVSGNFDYTTIKAVDGWLKLSKKE